MGEDRSHRCHRARRVAVSHLTIHLVGDRALAEGDHHSARRFGDRRHLYRGEMTTDLRRLQCDAVFRHAGTRVACLLQQREQRAVRRQKIREPAPREHNRAGLKEFLRRRVRQQDALVAIHHQHGVRERVQDSLIALHWVCAENGRERR
jgi:hypothetical protein